MNFKNKTIVFQGDSITDAAWNRNLWDHNGMYGHGYAFLVASKLEFEDPRLNMTVHNRGISGDRSADVLARWQEQALDFKPDLISLLVGINDLICEASPCGGIDAQNYKKNLIEIMEMTKAQAPNAKVVMLEPFGFYECTHAEHVDTFRDNLPERRAIAKEVAEQYGCLFIPLQQDFYDAVAAYPELGHKYWLWDGIHPTPAGHQLIARKWLKFVSEWNV